MEPCCAEGAHHITEAQTITSTLETLFPGRWHHVATPVAAEVAVVVDAAAVSAAVTDATVDSLEEAAAVVFAFR